MKFFFFWCAVLSSSLVFSQREISNPNSTNNGSKPKFSQSDSASFFNPKYRDYTFWTEKEALQAFDTANTIENYYVYRNFNNKNDFGSIRSTTIGNFINPLVYETSTLGLKLMPFAKQDFHYSENDIRYYNVKTPMTEFIYHNGEKEGHILNTLFTHNLHSRWNYAFQYRGLKSLGKYLNNVSNKNNFVISTNYKTKSGKYAIWSHFSNENNDNEENGGIQNESDFEDGLSQLRNRQRITTRLQDATSSYDYRRYFIGQELGLMQKYDGDSTLYFPISIRNKFSYESIEYVYKDTDSDTLYTNNVSPLLYTSIARRSEKRNKNFYNYSSVKFQWKKAAQVELGLKYQNFRLYYPENLQVGSLTIPEEITDNRLGFSGNVQLKWNDFVKLHSEAEFLSGSYFKSTYSVKNFITIKPIDKYSFEGKVHILSQTPSLQLLTNQSFYSKFNYHVSDFKNENTLQLVGKVHLEKYKASISANLFRIENYMYFDSDYAPKQLDGTVSIAQIQGEYRFQFRKFHADARVVYQQIDSENDVLPLPNFIGNLALYYQSNVFKNAANLQTGITISYFSAFKSREFFPVINEFMIGSSDKEMGNFPMMNVFANLKVKTMRIYVEAQHFNSSFTGFKYYSAPKYPFTDFRLNIGLVWLLFT